MGQSLVAQLSQYILWLHVLNDPRHESCQARSLRRRLGLRNLKALLQIQAGLPPRQLVCSRPSGLGVTHGAFLPSPLQQDIKSQESLEVAGPRSSSTLQPSFAFNQPSPTLGPLNISISGCDFLVSLAPCFLSFVPCIPFSPSPRHSTFGSIDVCYVFI